MPALPARDAEAALSGRQRGADRGNRGRRALAGRNRVAVPRHQPQHGGPAATPAVAQPQHRPFRSGAFRCLASGFGRRFAAVLDGGFGSGRLGRRCSGFCRCFGSDQRRLARDSLASGPGSDAPPRPAPAGGVGGDAGGDAAHPRRSPKRSRPARLPAAYRAASPASPATVGPGSVSGFAALSLASRSPAEGTGRSRQAGGGFGRIHVGSLGTLCGAASATRRDQPNSIARQKSREARAQRSGSSRFTPCP